MCGTDLEQGRSTAPNDRCRCTIRMLDVGLIINYTSVCQVVCTKQSASETRGMVLWRQLITGIIRKSTPAYMYVLQSNSDVTGPVVFRAELSTESS